MSFNSDENEKISAHPEMNREMDSLIITPLKLMAILSAISGILALIFEVRTMVMHSLDVYFSRLIATIVAFIVLVIAQTDYVKKNIEFLIHVMVMAVIFSSAFIVYRIPESFQSNSNFTALYIFMLGLAIGWNFKHQIYVISYFLITYGVVIILRPEIFNNTDLLYETTTIVVVLAVMSIISSFLVSKTRNRLVQFIEAESNKSDDINLEEQSQSKFKDFLDHSLIGFYQFNSEGKILYANRALAKLLGYKTVKEISNKNAYELIFNNASIRTSLDKILSDNKIIKNFRMKLIKADGSESIVKISERLIQNGSENASVYEGSLIDITQQIKTETARKKEFEKLKAESSQANYAASSAVYNSNVKSQFLAKMSHEIRTPLNSVLGFLTLIENGLYENKEELKDFAYNARISSDSLLDTINNVLDLSKIEAGKMELNEDEFSIGDEIEKAISIIKTTAKEKNLEVNSNISADVPISLIGDSTRYRQVVVNLLSNATKYSKIGSIYVEVEVLKTTAATIKLLTTVRDTGIGIKKEKIPQLFKPYTQLSNDNLANRKGTGLGLIICKDFVELMGGKIDVESEEGKGTTIKFTVILGIQKNFLKSKDYIEMSDAHRDEGIGKEKIVDGGDIASENSPKIAHEESTNTSRDLNSNSNETIQKNDKDLLLSSNQIKPLVEQQSNLRPSFPKTSLSKKRLLLVEDNPISQRVELKLLRETGYSVDPVSNAYDAIAAIKSNSFDLVLMDIEMEDMDGIEATQKIRALDPPVNNIPIIAVTAHSSMKDRERCLAGGMDDYIAKPINIHFLKMTIDQWLKSERN